MRYLILLICGALALSGTAAELPFTETFDSTDGITTGTLSGQNNWTLSGTSANVQSSIITGGDQALEIQDAQVSHELSSDGSAIWLNFQARISAKPETNPEVSNANTSLAFFVNTNLNLVVYSNTTPVTLDTQIEIGSWTRFDIYCDYSELRWNLSVDGTNVAAGLPLYSSSRQVESIVIANNSTEPIYVDEIDISAEEQVAASNLLDFDQDGLPDWWEQKHFGDLTSCNPEAASQNNGLTYRQAYIAGLNPHALEHFSTSKLNGRRGLSWTALPGRLYDIYWTPDLTVPFSNLATISWTQTAEFVDEETTEAAGFYQLKARME